MIGGAFRGTISRSIALSNITRPHWPTQFRSARAISLTLDYCPFRISSPALLDRRDECRPMRFCLCRAAFLRIYAQVGLLALRLALGAISIYRRTSFCLRFGLCADWPRHYLYFFLYIDDWRRRHAADTTRQSMAAVARHGSLDFARLYGAVGITP